MFRWMDKKRKWWNPGKLHYPKHPAKRGGREGTKREDPKSKPKDQNPKWVTKEHRNKSCSKAPTIIARSISERERNEKRSTHRRALTCNDIMPQNKHDLSSLQSYLSSLQSCWHPLLRKSTQNRWPQLSAKLLISSA